MLNNGIKLLKEKNCELQEELLRLKDMMNESTSESSEKYLLKINENQRLKDSNINLTNELSIVIKKLNKTNQN